MSFRQHPMLIADSLDIVNPAINPRVGTGSGLDILELFLKNFISLILGAAGVTSFIIFLWGAFSYIMAGGDKEATQAAQKRMTASLIGLVLTLCAFAIIFIVETVFGIPITQFTIPVIN